MALKKGSAAAKAWGRKMQRARNSKTRKSYSKRRTSPRRKPIKYKTRTMVKRKTVKRKSSKRSKSFFGINLGKAGSSILYGGIRARTSNALAPYTSRIPLGNVSDEAGMLLATTLAKKYLFKKAGFMRDALTAGQNIEFARIGETIATGNIGINIPFITGNAAPTSSGYVFN